MGAPGIEPATSDSAAFIGFEPESSQNDGPGGDPNARALTRPGPAQLRAARGISGGTRASS